MALFDETTMQKVGKSDWYTGADFEGDGLVLQIKAVEKVKSQFGAAADNAMVEREILEEGEVFRYTFADATGEEKNFDSHSMPFMIGMQNAEFNIGDWLHIKRTGKLRDTRYVVEKATAPEAPVSPAKPESTDEIDPKDIPF